jgi:hypothetical protein
MYCECNYLYVIFFTVGICIRKGSKQLVLIILVYISLREIKSFNLNQIISYLVNKNKFYCPYDASNINK